MTNISHIRGEGPDEIQAARASVIWTALKAERWSLRLLEQRTHIPKSTLSAKMNGHSPMLAADIELFAEILGSDPVELFRAYLGGGDDTTNRRNSVPKVAGSTPVGGTLISFPDPRARDTPPRVGLATVVSIRGGEQIA